MARTAFVYPAANTAHVIGAIMLVGAIGLLDLRILGYARGLAPEALTRAATPIAFSGFAIMLFSGAILFLADAETLAASALFRVKLALIALAVLNALYFRMRWPHLAEPLPQSARLLAGASLAFWVAIVVLGRLIAYY